MAKWTPNAWSPLDVQQIDEEKMKAPVKSFYNYQDMSDAYEVREFFQRLGSY